MTVGIIINMTTRIFYKRLLKKTIECQVVLAASGCFESYYGRLVALQVTHKGHRVYILVRGCSQPVSTGIMIPMTSSQIMHHRTPSNLAPPSLYAYLITS